MSVCTVKCTVYVPCTVYSVCTVYSEDKMEHSTCTAALSMFVCVEKCYKCCFLNLLHVLYSVQCTVMILVPFVTIFFHFISPFLSNAIDSFFILFSVILVSFLIWVCSFYLFVFLLFVLSYIKAFILCYLFWSIEAECIFSLNYYFYFFYVIFFVQFMFSLVLLLLNLVLL